MKICPLTNKPTVKADCEVCEYDIIDGYDPQTGEIMSDDPPYDTHDEVEDAILDYIDSREPFGGDLLEEAWHVAEDQILANIDKRFDEAFGAERGCDDPDCPIADCSINCKYHKNYKGKV